MRTWLLSIPLLLAVGCVTASKPAEAAKVVEAKPAASLPVCDLVADEITLVAFRDAAGGAMENIPASQIRVGDKILFNHFVFNGGPAAIPADAAFEVELLLDGRHLTGDSQPSAIGEKRYITYTVRGWHWVAEKPGRHSCRLVVRPGPTINDPNPANNTLDREFEVSP